MSNVVDNLIAFKILYMLVKPFEQTDAFKLGIIDKDGNNLIKPSSLKTSEQKDAYSHLDRLVFKLKKIINKIGGENKLKSLIAALWLIKESRINGTSSYLEERYNNILSLIDSISLIEEELLVSDFLHIIKEDMGGAPVNSIGDGSKVGIDQPFRKKRKFQSFVVNDDIFRRFKNGKTKYRNWADYLNLEDDGQRAIYTWAKKNPNGVLVLKNGKEMKAIRFNRSGGGSWSKIKRPVKQVNNEVI